MSESRCIEINNFKIKEGEKIKNDFIHEMKERHRKMSNRNIYSYKGFYLYKKDNIERTYVRFLIWDSKEIAMQYAEERSKKENFIKFLHNNIEEYSVEFWDNIELTNGDKANM